MNMKDNEKIIVLEKLISKILPNDSIYESIKIVDWSKNDYNGKLYPEFTVKLKKGKKSEFYSVSYSVGSSHIYHTQKLADRIEEYTNAFLPGFFTILRANITILI